MDWVGEQMDGWIEWVDRWMNELNGFCTSQANMEKCVKKT